MKKNAFKKANCYTLGLVIFSSSLIKGAEPKFPIGRSFDSTYLESYYPPKYSSPGKESYGLPSGNELISKIRKDHPRVWFTKDDINKVKSAQSKSTELGQYISYLNEKSLGLIKRNPEGKVTRHQDLWNEFKLLGFAYHVNGDPSIPPYALKLMRKALSDPSLGKPREAFCYESHALGTGYDLFCEAWSKEDRAQIDESLRKFIDKGIELVRDAMGVGGASTGRTNIGIQSQASYIVLCAALADRYPNECSEIIDNFLYTFASALEELNPDGGWREGPGYWGYTLDRGIIPVLVTLRSGWGTTFGLEKMPGLDKSGQFLPYVTGPVNDLCFAFGDSREKMGYSTSDLFYATFFKDKSVAWFLKNSVQKKSYVEVLKKLGALPIPYEPEVFESPVMEEPPLSKQFKRIELGSFRSSWNDNNGWFVAFKGGWGSEAHGNLHAGSFVLDAMGERWISHGAGTSYDAEDCWNYSPMGGRWRLYGARAESKNCFVVNLDFIKSRNAFPYNTLNNYTLPDQAPFSFSEIEKFNLNDQGSKLGGKAVIDLTPAYRDFCNSAKRGYQLHKSGDKVTIQDEVRFRKNGFFDSWWLSNVYKETEINIASNGKTAILSKNGKKLRVTLTSDMESAKFQELPSTPLPKSDAILAEPKNWSIYKRLAIHLVNDDRSARNGYILRVDFENAANSESQIHDLLPLNKW